MAANYIYNTNIWSAENRVKQSSNEDDDRHEYGHGDVVSECKRLVVVFIGVGDETAEMVFYLFHCHFCLSLEVVLVAYSPEGQDVGTYVVWPSVRLPVLHLDMSLDGVSSERLP